MNFSLYFLKGNGINKMISKEKKQYKAKNQFQITNFVLRFKPKHYFSKKNIKLKRFKVSIIPL